MRISKNASSRFGHNPYYENGMPSVQHTYLPAENRQALEIFQQQVMGRLNGTYKQADENGYTRAKHRTINDYNETLHALAELKKADAFQRAAKNNQLDIGI